jgi:hypothetical protein
MTARRQLVCIALAAAAAAGLLHLAGRGSLSGPEVGSWDEIEVWYEQRGAGASVVVLVRLAAFVASGWLALAAALQVVAATMPVRSLVTLADQMSPRFLRAVARGAASLSMSAGLALPAASVELGVDPPGTAIMVPLDVEATTTSTTLPPPTTTLPPPVPPPAPAAPAPIVGSTEVVVRPGGSFWSIAVAEAGSRDLVVYWRALIAENRDRLVDPGNPDLLFVGQRLVLPRGQ